MASSSFEKERPVQSDTHAFIVRIWFEAEDDEEDVYPWRGSVDHVGAAQRLYFHDLDVLMRFIQEQAGINGEFPNPPIGTSAGPNEA